jgi:thioredoxin reductase/NAD-dependent dihydropyrimidine dehydrogenase PreA subunit
VILVLCLLGGAAAAAGGAALRLRRADLAALQDTLDERRLVARAGASTPALQVPHVDLTRCLGCGTCIRACPEDDVLALVHGQAQVVRSHSCVGATACASECPTGAITVAPVAADLRTDVPALTEELEAVGTPGLFLAGEVTGLARIRTAVEHGTRVAASVARRAAERHGVETADGGALDLLIVGAGPAGLACALEAKRLGLRFTVLDRDAEPGGAIAHYPRAKLVLAQALELPLFGKLKGRTFRKEQLLELWRQLVDEHALPIQQGVGFEGLERDAHGVFVANTTAGPQRAACVALALGRRGDPVPLGVPGEELPKVAYGLIDAHSHQGQRIVVVGGGDSAVEAALGLSDQPGNRVTLAYRGETFFRVRRSNRERLQAAVERGDLELLRTARLTRIAEGAVTLAVGGEGQVESRELPNDLVFVLTGGKLPLEQLTAAGVSFDPADRPVARPPGERGAGLSLALRGAAALLGLTLLFGLVHLDYFGLESADRAVHPKHDWLRPGRALGLWLGVGACLLILVNLAYLLRRDARFKLRFGALSTWMTSHVVTGVGALLLAWMHAGFAVGSTVGGRAFLALVVLMITGAVGRYLYAQVPRAANGRELALSEIEAELERSAREAGSSGFHRDALEAVRGLAHARQWGGGLFARLGALFGAQHDLRAICVRLQRLGAEQGVAESDIARALDLARRAHRHALASAHFEDMRGALQGWRYLHRWFALLMVLLVLLHVVAACLFGDVGFGVELVGEGGRGRTR